MSEEWNLSWPSGEMEFFAPEEIFQGGNSVRVEASQGGRKGRK